MNHKKNLVVLFLMFANALASGVSAQTKGILSGSVLLDGKQPLAGATVLFNRVPELRPDSSGHIISTGVMLSSKATTGSDGKFQTGQIPVGDYYLCAKGTLPNHLRSCDWGGMETFVHLTGTTQDGSVTLNVRTGALLTINVDDPAGHIQIRDSSGINAPPTNLTINVNAGRYYYPSKVSGPQGSRWVHTAAIPIATSVNLFVDSELDLLDSSGIAVPKRQPVSPLRALDSSGLATSFVIN